MANSATVTQNTSSAVTNYRWFVFLLGLGFWLYQFAFADMTLYGIQFRYLTIWGLTASVITSWFMLRYSLGKSDKTYNPFVSASVVLGVIVVFMYWKLFFTDPTLVNGDHIMPWYQEYYLHGISQGLMMIDAFFILGAFKKIWSTVATCMVIFLSYIAFTELFVRPMNVLPLGTADSGFPYPFLNDMVIGERLVFYVTTIATALLFLGLGWALARLIAKLKQTPAHG